MKKALIVLSVIILLFFAFVIGYSIDPSFTIISKENAAPDIKQDNEEEEKYEADEEKCQNLWWYDKDNKICKEKEFCGAYMYFGLKTFKEKSECDKSLKEYLSFPSQTQEEKDNLLKKIGTGEYSADELIDIIGSN